MKIEVFNSSTPLYERAAELVANEIKKKKTLNLGLAAGATPTPLYNRLSALAKDKKLSFDGVTSFNLDEYVGQGLDSNASFASYTYYGLANRVGISKERFHFLNGAAPDAGAECARYDALIKSKGGIDLQILGLGVNGHIAFNEPGSSPTERTRVVKLSSETVLRLDPKLFPKGKPSQGLTLGLANIMESKMIVLIAVGPQKAQAVRDCFISAPSPQFPASVLQSHPNCFVLVDRDASKLSTTA